MFERQIGLADKFLASADVWSTLAGLRFFFAMWVLFDHTYNFGPESRAMPVFTKSGLVAVMCFFVISGFSIHHSINVRPDGYGQRRFWRIAPINTLAVAIGWLAWSVFGLTGGYGTPPLPPPWWKFLGNLFLLQCIVPVMIHFLFPAWSLSIEGLYYAIAPTLLRLKSRVFLVEMIAIFSCSFFIAWPLIGSVYIAEPTYGVSAAALFWSWLGGWLAYTRRSNHCYAAALIVGGLVGISTQAKYFGIVDLTSAAANFAAWSFTVVVVFYGPGFSIGKKGTIILEYLGDISYPLYLLHYPILFALTSSVLMTHPDWNYGITQVAVSLISAILAYHFVDRPLRSGFKALPLKYFPRMN